MIPYWSSKKKLESDRLALHKTLREIISTGSILMGKNLSSFERNWGDFNKTKYASGVSSGLDAIHLALLAMGVKEGDEVIVPSNTYIATWIGVSMCGATPIPVEPDIETCCIDPKKIKRAISKKTKAVLPTHLYGHPAPMKEIIHICKKHNLKVISDGAQGHGAEIETQPIGAFGDATAWSFYPTKNLGALGDAGAVTTPSRCMKETIDTLRNYGSKERYVNEIIGRNNRLEELQAGFLVHRLKSLKKDIEKRRILASRYLEGLADLTSHSLRLPKEMPWAKHAWHIFQIQHTKRDWIQQELKRAGVGTLIHYPIPPHLQEAYRFLGYQKGDFPVAEKIHSQTLSLPLYPELTWKEQSQVLKNLKKILTK